MSADVNEYYHEFFQEVQRNADADGRFTEDSFFELFTGHLIDAGELETADRAQYLAARGIRIDGYGGDPVAADGVLSLIISDFNQSSELETLTGTEMDNAFKRAIAFLSKSLDAKFRHSLEETSQGFGLADLIASTWSAVRKVRIFLITNRLLSSRVDGRESGELDGRPIVYSVWDLGRLFRYVSSGKSREDLIVNMSEHGGALNALPAHLDDAGYEAYLMVVPGTQLASIYDRWGARLLEQNVRVFLQAKGSVNKGIRNTIENAPEMFFAYNNGITATAESIQTKTTTGGLLVTGLKNLQIVNGGQTTASIYAASRAARAGLGKVFVQMKLSIIPPDQTEEVVPKISEFANSQNKVSAADFFANHPFHLRMEEFSRRLFAPSPDGTFRETKWFYERARGQYQDARSNLTVAEKKRFDIEYPKKQLITKTDLAKFLIVWDGRPDIVSKGAQKNFAYFASEIGKEWANQPDAFNESFFRQAIAKAIVFRGTETLVSNESWYDGGYRAQIVAYAIAKLGEDVQRAGKSIDFDAVWREQTIPADLAVALIAAATAANQVIVDPPAGTRNITEWAKHQACWTRVAALKVAWPSKWWSALLSAEEQESRSRGAIREQRLLNGIEAQTAVFRAGGEYWRAIRDWGTERRFLSQKELDILTVAAAIPSKIPSESQSAFILKTLEKLRGEGCPLAEKFGR